MIVGCKPGVGQIGEDWRLHKSSVVDEDMSSIMLPHIPRESILPLFSVVQALELSHHWPLCQPHDRLSICLTSKPNFWYQTWRFIVEAASSIA
jgi:hypothetical protein